VKIPKKLKVGGFVYTIEFPYFFRESNELVGQHAFDELKIKISDVDHLDKMSDQKIVATLMHEVVHAVDHVYWSGVGIMSEDEIDMISRGLFQVIRNNKLELDKLPKKVNVLGFDYTIAYPYTFIDEDNCITASFHEKCVICIGKSANMSVSYAYFLTQLIASIFSINCLPQPNPDPLRLGRGIYGVLVENKWLLPMIKEV